MSPQNISIHYDKYHQGYVEKLNRLAQTYPELQRLNLEQIVQQYGGDAGNFASQILNHNFLWQSLSPNGGYPSDRIYQLILNTYGSYENFIKEFNRQAIQFFGSGYIWLIYDPTTIQVRIVTGENAYNPIRDGFIALLTLDLWEHSYYPDHLNDKQAYLNTFWNFVNWSNVEAIADTFVFGGVIRGPI